MAGLIKNIADMARKNTYFRQEVETGDLTQIVIMSLPPGGEIGMEVHEDTDQVLYILDGTGRVILDGQESDLAANDIVLVHKGTRHNFVNGNNGEMKIITTY